MLSHSHCYPRWRAPRPPAKPQRRTSADQVPKGLTTSDWTSIRAAYEAGQSASQAVEFVAQQAYLKPAAVGTAQEGDGFGISVAVSGDTVVVGAPGEDSSTTGINGISDELITNSGAAYVFVRSGTTWTQQAYLKPAVVGTSQRTDQFGTSVAVSGDTVVVGAPLEDSSTTGINSTPNDTGGEDFNSGAAYVFMRSGTTWTQQAYLKAAAVGTTQAGDGFGISVAISDDTIVVGASGEDSSTTGTNSTPNEGAVNSGAAYVFTRSGTTWTQQAYLKPAVVGTTQVGDLFGYAAVAVSGDTIVVGASGEDSSTTGINSTPNEGAVNSGAAYVFTRSGTTWTQQAYLKASNTGANDYFGGRVAISGDTVVAGAVWEDSRSTGVNSTPDDSGGIDFNSGAAYVFIRSGTTWTQQGYLKPTVVGSTQANDHFGFSVAASGDTVVVGAIAEDSSTTGVNSIPNENARDSGAAYIFVRSGATWTQQEYLKPAAVGTTQAGDQFGYSVAVSTDRVVVGAFFEQSSTTGVNSIPDENAYAAGAAYVFGDAEPQPAIGIEQPPGANVSNGGERSFGSVAVGVGASLTFIIRNTGNIDLTGLGITIDGPDAAMFALTALPTAPVSAPNGSTTFAVRFTPTSLGPKTAALHIASNDPNENPFNITLTGTGIPPGTVDSGFNPNAAGNSVLASPGQPDGRIVIGGLFTSVSGQARNNIARLAADGSVESTAVFNPGTAANDQVYGVAVQVDGKIVLGGAFTSVNGQARARIARLLSNGNVESTATFNAGTGANEVVYGAAIQSDGRIVLCGEFTSVNEQARGHIARLNTNGSVESTATFDPGTGADAGVQSVAVQADGRIVLAGQFMNVNGLPRGRIARLNADGTVESTATFDAGTGADDVVYCVAIQPDGRVLLAGQFASVNGTPRGGIARLEANGVLESTATFDPGTGANGPIYGVALQADGRILIAGDFTSVNGESRNRIARLNADGSLESTATFDIGTGANDFVGGVTLQADGKILLCGGFTQVDGQTRNLVARLANATASSALTIPTSARVQWMRGGTAPEVEQVTFELSTNGGTSWSALGVGTRIAGGWERTGLSLSGAAQIRARGRTSGGTFNGSGGLIEQIAVYDFVTQPPTLTAPATNAQTTSPVSIAFTLPEMALANSVKLTFDDGVTPRVLTLAASQEAAGAHAFSFDIANPLASPAIASGPALPEGTYTVTLSYQDALNPPASSTPATNVRIAVTPLRLWKLVQLGDANAPDLGNIDGDAFVHLAEYGLVLSPVAPNAPLGVTRFAYAEGARLRIFLTRDPARNDVTIEVQAGPAPEGLWTVVATSALGAPFTGAGYVGGDGASAGLKTVEVRDIVNMNAAAARYLRVKVTD